MKTILCGRNREVIIDTHGPVIIIGESINPTRRKKLVSTLQEGNFEYVLELARIQIDATADVLDVNVGFPGVNDIKLLPETLKPDFHGMNFSAWQKLGKDRHSMVADPLFKYPQNFDFHFKSLKVAKKIDFVPFDYSKAGVSGEEEWKNLAKLDPGLMRKFDEAERKFFHA